MVIEENRGISFGTIFPYMVMEGNEGILFSTITNTVDVTVLLELVLYHSSIDFNPIVLFIWKAIYAYKALLIWTSVVNQVMRWLPYLVVTASISYINQSGASMAKNPQMCSISNHFSCINYWEQKCFHFRAQINLVCHFKTKHCLELL